MPEKLLVKTNMVCILEKEGETDYLGQHSPKQNLRTNQPRSNEMTNPEMVPNKVKIQKFSVTAQKWR